MRSSGPCLVAGALVFALSAPLAHMAQECTEHTYRAVYGDVVDYRMSPDGLRAVYLADQDRDEVFELYSLLVDGSQAAVRLNAQLVLGGDVGSFSISPDGTRVVYAADQELDQVTELFSVPIDGSSAPVKLDTGPEPNGLALSWQFSPDGIRVVFHEQDLGGVARIYSVPSGGGQPLELNGPLAPGASTFSFQISADSTRVVFIGDLDTEGVTELYSAPVDGQGPRVKLNQPLWYVDASNHGNVAEFAIAPDASRVVFRANPETDELLLVIWELFSAPIDGSQAPVELSADRRLAAGLAFTNAGDHVLYRAREAQVFSSELYVAPVDGNQAPVLVSGALQASGQVEPGYQVSPDDSRVVYRADAETDQVFELYSVSLDGSRDAVKLNGPLPAAADVQTDHRISPDGSRVVYRADQDTAQVFELFSAPIAGGSAAVRLNGQLQPNGDVERAIVFSPDGATVYYTAPEATQDYTLHAVPADGSSSSTELAGGMLVSAPSLRLTPGGDRLLFTGILDTEDINLVVELFRLPLQPPGDPAKLNPTLALGPLDGDILQHELLPDSSGVVYLARENQAVSLYRKRFEADPCPVRLAGSPLELFQGFVVSPEGSWVAMRARASSSLQPALYTVSLDAGAAPLLVSLPVPSFAAIVEFRISADGSRVVYRGDLEEDNRFELYSVPTDGSEPPVKLNGVLVAGGDVEPGFALVPDGSRVLFRVDANVNNVTRLFSATVDGSLPAVELDGPLPAGAQVQADFVISVDSSRVAFRAHRPSMASFFDLYTAPLDGSVPAVNLTGWLGSGGTVDVFFRFDPQADQILYRAAQDSFTSIELWLQPADGSSGALRLNGPLVNNGHVGFFAQSPDLSSVVYEADAFQDGRRELFRVPIDGSGNPVTLNDPFGPFGGVNLLEITPDGERVLFLQDQQDQELGTRLALWSVLLDRSQSPIQLSASGSFQAVDFARVAADSGYAVYRGDEDVDDVREVFSAPVDGSTAAVQLNRPLVANGGVELPIRITADGARVLFIADLVEDEVYELFVTNTDGSGGSDLIHTPLAPRKASRRQAPTITD